MKKLLLIFITIPFFGFSQQLYWYDVFFEVEAGNGKTVTTLVDNYYSTVERTSDIAVSF